MRAWKNRWVRVAVALALPLLAAAAEEKPKTLAEAKAAFAKADKALNEAWAAAKKALGESEFAELQIKQRDWLKYREDQARGANRENSEPEGKQTAAYFEAAAALPRVEQAWMAV